MNMHCRLLETEVSLPQRSGNNTNDSYISETTFDTNMVVILAVLLRALICALGLNSIVRCALRCSRRLAMETPDQEGARSAPTGLKKRELKVETNPGGRLRRRREFPVHRVLDLSQGVRGWRKSKSAAKM
ncbi:RING-H2 finger protein ATL73 [Hibiscus syriacus]|uniref:RING-type E3 ubiquitin transferase n=1 Tax=Hibiscus syriacus TaxID=106335 RepID=A0A6A2ZT22_HIBSY|nr:RING-H2 finger protein ATL73 [Hibiscus syriacus]